MKLKIKISGIFLIIAFFFFSQSLSAQKQAKIGCIGFYNLENFFDTIQQDNLNGEEFTPDGIYHWNTEKYHKKLKNMSEVVSRIGDELVKGGPIIMGFSEIENRSILEDMIVQPALKPMNYGIVHYDSPDRRGIDVGLIYQKAHFNVIKSYPVEVTMPDDTSFRTRSQLVVNGMFDGEPIWVIVNHWPSRSGGEKKSEPKRARAAQVCRSIADSIIQKDPNAKIIIMGDLNDDPTDKSLLKYLKAKKTKEETKPGDLYNPMYKLFKDGIGSLAYRDSWNLFDQIIVSYPLTEKDKSSYRLYQAKIYNKSYLTTKEGQYTGYPMRTFSGTTFMGGYSDHFPSYIFLVKEN
ncbi:MAG: endonuclease/exonuclease/phosphatase family protein [Bacteroidetes bacterium]|nr:endonuclease/exonuclease/phosphatase family protein [Bacteroidota bacterium]